MRKHLIIATRGSQLALWQANHVKECLEEQDPSLRVSLNIIRTKGDIIQNVPLSQVGGKGLFVKEIEEALVQGRADMAVHSVKDVPMKLPDGLILGCVPKRESSSDCFLSEKYKSFEDLPEGAILGTSSLRRQAQVLALRPDLEVHSLRGNIDTRLRKMKEGQYDAIILATAGLFRLGLHASYMRELDPERFLPAVGQGALGIECLEDNYELLVALASLEDRPTRVCVDAERAFLAALDGGCQVPIAAHAIMPDEESIILDGLIAEPDGSKVLRGERVGDATWAERIGGDLGVELLDKGGEKILRKLYSDK